MSRGDRFVEAGKYTDAALLYQKAIQKSPNLGEAHYRLGLLDLKIRQRLPAYRELSRAAELMPGNREVLAAVGKLAVSLYVSSPDHPPQLYEQASKVARQLPAESFDGNLIKGAIASLDKKPADAVLCFRKAVEAKPADPDAAFALVGALAQDNQAAAAISLAQSMVNRNKAFGPAYDFLYEQYKRAGKNDDAENILKLKVANNPRETSFILELARYYAAMRNPAGVDATTEKITANPKDFPDGRLLAGDFYLSLGKSDVALQQYNAGLGAAKFNKNVYRTRIVRILASQQKWPEAYRELDAALKDQPADEQAKLMRALAWLAEGKPQNLDPAITELRAQSAKRPNDAALHFQIGTALARKADAEGARREWRAAAQVNRNYLPPRFSLAQLDLVQGKAQEALQVSDQIIGVAPSDAQANLLHATCLTAAGQYQKARMELERMASQFPKSPQVRFRVGMLAIAERRYQEAEEAFHQIEGTVSKDPEVLAGLAEAFEGENQGARAIQLLQDELKRNPNSPALHLVLARLAGMSGKYDIAIDQYKQLATASPGGARIQLLLAAAYTAKGDATNAQSVLERAVQAEPKSVPASLMLAQALVATGRVDEAEARYRKILVMQPSNANALNDLAYLMAESGEDLDQALANAQRGLKYAVEPGLKASLSDTMGWIYVKKNMTDTALQIFQTQVSGNANNATFRYHLGFALYQRGEKQKARAELEAALAAKPAAPDERKIRQMLAKF